MGKSNDFTVNDPIHGMICFKADANGNNLIKDLISTPEFQRLRRIKQLGCVDFVYPGATHTRFAHSIGVAHLVNKTTATLLDKNKEIFHKLNETQYLQGYSIEQVILAVTCAGLLHDIGHGPFGHSLERKFIDKSHEELALEILNHNTKIGKVLKDSCDGNLLPKSAFEDIKFLISSKSYSISKNSKDNIDKTGFNLLPFKDVISSELDCDRFDYLQRDTYFAGTPIRIDHNYIIQNLSILYVDDANKYKLVVNQKARPALEHYLLSRKLHYDQVAFHKTAISAEHLLKMIVSGGSKPDLFKPKEDLSIESFLEYDDEKIMFQIKEQAKDGNKDIYISYLCKCFLNRELPKKLKEKPYNGKSKNYYYERLTIMDEMLRELKAKLEVNGFTHPKLSNQELIRFIFFPECNYKDYYNFDRLEYEEKKKDRKLQNSIQNLQSEITESTSIGEKDSIDDLEKLTDKYIYVYDSNEQDSKPINLADISKIAESNSIGDKYKQFMYIDYYLDKHLKKLGGKS